MPFTVADFSAVMELSRLEKAPTAGLRSLGLLLDNDSPPRNTTAI